MAKDGWKNAKKVAIVGRKEELEAELRKIVSRLRQDRNVKLILLFGSLARGEVGEGSDLDLIVVKETEKKFLDRLEEFYREAGIAMDILVYTPGEFEEMRNRNFIKKAIEEGIILYEA